MIACLRVPHFEVLAARQTDPALAVEPLALVEDGRVRALSEGAAQSGVGRGMPVSQARALCPNLHLAPADVRSIYRATDELLETLSQFASKVEVEPASQPPRRLRGRPRLDAHLHPPLPDDDPLLAYLDLGRLTGEQGLELGHAIHRAVRPLLPGADPRLGLASGKFTARVVALSLDPHHILLVPRSSAAEFLAPFPTVLLPIDGETLRQLDLLGLRTLGQVAGLSSQALFNRFGEAGRLIYKLVTGADPGVVRPYVPKLVEQVSRQLEGAVENRAALEAVVETLAGELCNRLDRAGRAAREVDLALSQDDGRTQRRGLALREPSSAAWRIARAAVELLDALPLTAGVAEVELRLTGVAPAALRQLHLFEREPVGGQRLREALDGLVARYGEGSFLRIVVADPDARLDEDRYRLRSAVEL